jgi:hypothetical protein
MVFRSIGDFTHVDFVFGYVFGESWCVYGYCLVMADSDGLCIHWLYSLHSIRCTIRNLHSIVEVSKCEFHEACFVSNNRVELG